MLRLTAKCSPQVPVCEQLVPAGGAVLGDCGTFWSWDGGVSLVVTVHQGYTFDCYRSAPSSSLSSLHPDPLTSEKIGAQILLPVPLSPHHRPISPETMSQNNRPPLGSFCDIVCLSVKAGQHTSLCTPGLALLLTSGCLSYRFLSPHLELTLWLLKTRGITE